MNGLPHGDNITTLSVAAIFVAAALYLARLAITHRRNGGQQDLFQLREDLYQLRIDLRALQSHLEELESRLDGHKGEGDEK